MNSVGVILRTERERQGRETGEIAGELCIMQRYLLALEQDDIKSLPGSFFYKSFVKQYAAVLRIDENLLQPAVEALLAAAEAPAPAVPDPRSAPYSSTPPIVNFSSEVPLMTPQGGQGIFETFKSNVFGDRPANIESAQMGFGIPEESGQSPIRNVDPIVRDANRRYLPEGRVGVSLVALVAVLLACSGFYAWWNKTPPSVARAASDRGASGRSASDVTGETGGIPLRMASASSPRSGPVGPALNVTTTTGPDGVNRVVLNLSATEKTWLSITCDGKRIFSGVLEPSQTKTLFGSDVATMKVGNAAGIEVLWNGKSIGPIGPRGQVREVLFTPDNFEIKQPAKPL